MTALELIKDIYKMSGGDPAELDSLSKNDPNMISAIYGDGLNTKLPNGVMDTIVEMLDYIAENGGGGYNRNNLDTIPLLYSVTREESDGDLGYVFEEYENTVDFGLSKYGSNHSAMGWSELCSVMEQAPYILIYHNPDNVWLLPKSATYTNPNDVNSESSSANVFWTCDFYSNQLKNNSGLQELTFGCKFVNTTTIIDFN